MPAGALVSHLLWTADACLLTSILGWVTCATAVAAALYLWYMVLCFWKVLRKATEDIRRVLRAIASLPARRYSRVAADAESPDDGEGDTCAICLGEFEVGEEVRLSSPWPVLSYLPRD